MWFQVFWSNTNNSQAIIWFQVTYDNSPFWAIIDSSNLIQIIYTLFYGFKYFDQIKIIFKSIYLIHGWLKVICPVGGTVISAEE